MKNEMKKILGDFLINKNAEIISILLILIFIISNFTDWWLNSVVYKYWFHNWSDILNYFTYIFIHWWVYHIIFNVIAILSIKDLLRWKFIWEFFSEILLLSLVSTVIFDHLNPEWWILVWFSGVFFWVVTKILLEKYFYEKNIEINWNFIWLIFILNIFLIPYLFPEVSWVIHFSGMLAWVLVFLFQYIFKKYINN